MSFFKKHAHDKKEHLRSHGNTLKVEIRRITVPGQPGQKVLDTPT
jgi:hypothetical protein